MTYPRSHRITPAQLGFNATAVNAQATSNTFWIGDYNTISLEYDYTYGAATGDLTMLFEVSNDGTDWDQLETLSWSGGVGTLTEGSFVEATAAGDIGGQISFALDGQKYMRLKATVAGGSPTTSDTLTCAVTLRT